MENGGEVQLLVSQGGYALYRVGKHTTVFPIHSCGNYCYENNGQQICVCAAFFEQQEWYVRLLLVEKEQIMELMGLLTERQRDIVILYFYYGETQWEIAKALAFPSLQFLRHSWQHCAV